MSIEVREYVADDGHNPYHSWLVNLKDREARFRIRARIDRLSLGNFGDTKVRRKWRLWSCDCISVREETLRYFIKP